MRTDEYTSGALMDAYFGRPVRYKMPLPWTWGGTINHRREGMVAALWQARGGAVKVALEQLLGFLRHERETGHCGTELLTPSHAAHHYRAMACALRIAWDRTRRARHLPLWDVLLGEVLDWWDREGRLCVELLVTHGPLAGRIVGWGARFSKGGNSDERNVTWALIRGWRHRKSEGYFKRAITRPDTFPCLVVRQLVADGAFDRFLDSSVSGLVVAFPLAITRHENGHVCQVEGQSPKDPDRVVVRYSDGLVWARGGKAPSKGEEPGDLGGVAGEVRLQGATK